MNRLIQFSCNHGSTFRCFFYDVFLCLVNSSEKKTNETVLPRLCCLYVVRSLPASVVSSGEKLPSDCDENVYMSPTSLPVSGTPWVITGSLVPPPPAQATQTNDIR